MYKHIYVTKSYMPPREEYDAYLSRIWQTAWLTNMGELHEELKTDLKSYLGVSGLELFVNGHLALEMCIQAFDFPKGGEVITTPFSFASTTHAIVRQGLKPVFCDIREDDCTMDPAKIEELITDRTVAILPVHVYGNPCDTEAIESIAKKHGLKVIYDAAHAFGEMLPPGDASIMSFHATKVFHTIEGGAVLFDGESEWGSEYACTLYKLKNFGITGYDTVEYVGGNAKMNEFAAAMGLCNLKHIDEMIESRKRIDEAYRKKLSDTPGVRFLTRKDKVKYNYAYMPVVFEEPLDRDKIFDDLAAVNIHARKYFYPCINAYDCYPEYDENDTPAARDISKKILTLPIYPGLEMEAVDEICDIIRKQ